MKNKDEIHKILKSLEMKIDHIEKVLSLQELIGKKDIVLVVSSSVIGVVAAIFITKILLLPLGYVERGLLFLGVMIGLCFLAIFMIIGVNQLFENLFQN